MRTFGIALFIPAGLAFAYLIYERIANLDLSEARFFDDNLPAIGIAMFFSFIGTIILKRTSQSDE